MGESPFAEICHPKKRAFLAAYAQTGNKSRAAKMSGIVKQTIYTRQWREDREFQTALDRARIMSADVLEAEAHRRAVEGWVEPVGWYKGVAGGTVRRYSDHLLIFTLKGLLPDRYRERKDVRSVLDRLDISRFAAWTRSRYETITPRSLASLNKCRPNTEGPATTQQGIGSRWCLAIAPQSETLQRSAWRSTLGDPY